MPDRPATSRRRNCISRSARARRRSIRPNISAAPESAARVAQHDAIAAVAMDSGAERIRVAARRGTDADLVARQRSYTMVDEDRIEAAEDVGVALLEQRVTREDPVA